MKLGTTPSLCALTHRICVFDIGLSLSSASLTLWLCSLLFFFMSADMSGGSGTDENFAANADALAPSKLSRKVGLHLRRALGAFELS